MSQALPGVFGASASLPLEVMFNPKAGVIDVIAVLTARMNGWRTRTFIEKHSVQSSTNGFSEPSAQGDC